MAERTPWFQSEQNVKEAAEDATRHILDHHQAYIYVLECQSGHRSSGELATHASGVLECPPDALPSWVWAAHHSDEVYYVGSTHNFEARLADHCFDRDRGAQFTGLFPVQSIDRVYGADSISEARQGERDWAEKLRDKWPWAFIYQA